jgi:proline iminopeptidase
MTSRRIDSLESFDIDGSAQWVLLRGDSARGRVLLIVQQGPGLPLIHEAQALERRLHLEAGAVVAYWDQRGTGKSWDADPSTISLGRLVADVRAMVDALCARLEGRSRGHPRTLDRRHARHAGRRTEPRAHRAHCRGRHRRRLERERAVRLCLRVRRGGTAWRPRAERQLLAIGAPPHDTSKKFLARVRWVTAYGGIHGAAASSDCSGTTCRRLLSRRTTRSAKPCRLCAPSRRRRSACSRPSTTSTSGPAVLAHRGPHRVLPGSTRRRDAPRPRCPLRRRARRAACGKSLVWFDASAHMPHYEEPARFREALLRALDIEPCAIAA